MPRWMWTLPLLFAAALALAAGQGPTSVSWPQAAMIGPSGAAITQTGLRQGIPAEITARTQLKYPPFLVDFDSKPTISSYTSASILASSLTTALNTQGYASTTAGSYVASVTLPPTLPQLPSFSLWRPLNNIGSPTGGNITQTSGNLNVHSGTVTATGQDWRWSDDVTEFIDGSDTDPSLNATYFETRVAITPNGANFVSAIGVGTNTTAWLTTAGALTGNTAVGFIITYDLANTKASVVFQVRRSGSSGTAQTLSVPDWNDAGDVPDAAISSFERFGFRCYGDFTNNNGHCLVFVNDVQVLDYADESNSGTGKLPDKVEPFMHFSAVNTGTPSTTQYMNVDYVLTGNTYAR